MPMNNFSQFTQFFNGAAPNTQFPTPGVPSALFASAAHASSGHGNCNPPVGAGQCLGARQHILSQP